MMQLHKHPEEIRSRFLGLNGVNGVVVTPFQVSPYRPHLTLHYLTLPYLV